MENDLNRKNVVPKQVEFSPLPQTMEIDNMSATVEVTSHPSPFVRIIIAPLQATTHVRDTHCRLCPFQSASVEVIFSDKGCFVHFIVTMHAAVFMLRFSIERQSRSLTKTGVASIQVLGLCYFKPFLAVRKVWSTKVTLPHQCLLNVQDPQTGWSRPGRELDCSSKIQRPTPLDMI